MDLIFICLCVCSTLFSLLHALEELYGPGGPLWTNFGNIVNVRIPDPLGFLLFTIGLPVALITIAFLGYCNASAIILSLLFGARVGDTLISHWGLSLLGLSNPNPGIFSTPLYVLEAIALFCFVPLQFLYVGIGVAFFASVLPLLWLTGRIIPSWRIHD